MIIMTANGKSLEPMINLIRDECGVDTQDKRYNIVGSEDVPHFGQAIANGDKVNVEEASHAMDRKKCCSCTFQVPKKQSISVGMHRASCIFGCHAISDSMQTAYVKGCYAAHGPFFEHASCSS